MKLLEKFQMRVDTVPGYTHVVERLPSGSYEVKWARGWSKVRDIEWHTCTKEEAQEFVDEGGWIVVDEKKVKQELPKVFNVRTSGGLYAFEQVSEYKWMCNAVPKSTLASLWSIDEILPNLEGGVWKIVVAEDKKVEQELPDEFYFHCCEVSATIYQAIRQGNKFDVTWDSMHPNGPVYYTEEQLVSRFNSGDWKMYKSGPLTPEQLRSNAEFREQISALEHNVKLRKQDAEHAEILIANYEARIKDLQSKLVKES